jgi:hypothetical protein
MHTENNDKFGYNWAEHYGTQQLNRSCDPSEPNEPILKGAA